MAIKSMNNFIILLGLFSACTIDPNSNEVTWSGIRPGPRTCIWGEYHEHADCITGGQAYSCLFDKKAMRVECARLSPTLPMEAP